MINKTHRMKRWVFRVIVGVLMVTSLGILAIGLTIVPPITGRVTDAVTGEPITGVHVALEIERFEGWASHTEVHAVAVTGDSGRFWLRPFVGWSIMGIGRSWVIVNHAPDRIGRVLACGERGALPPAFHANGRRRQQQELFSRHALVREPLRSHDVLGTHVHQHALVVVQFDSFAPGTE